MHLTSCHDQNKGCASEMHVYRMSDELHDLLRSQGVTRKRILFREELH